MAYKDPEKKREINRKYRENNREKCKESSRKYRENNPEKCKEYSKKYRETHPNRVEYEKEWKENNPEKVRKKNRKCKWKKNGLNMENFEEIYIRYEMAIFCDICECVLNVEGDYNTTKCMDHDHDTGDFRNIVCNYCNLFICK